MGWSSSLGIGRGANNSSPLKCILLRDIHRQSLGPGLILCYGLSNERKRGDLVLGAGDKIEKIEMGGARSSYGGGDKLVQDFGGET